MMVPSSAGSTVSIVNTLVPDQLGGNKSKASPVESVADLTCSKRVSKNS